MIAPAGIQSHIDVLISVEVGMGVDVETTAAMGELELLPHT